MRLLSKLTEEYLNKEEIREVIKEFNQAEIPKIKRKYQNLNQKEIKDIKKEIGHSIVELAHKDNWKIREAKRRILKKVYKQEITDNA